MDQHVKVTHPAPDAVERRTGVPQVLEGLPNDAMLPVRWVRELFAAWGELHLGPAALPAMLTTDQFAEHYAPKRSAEWVRDMCNADRFPGATRHGRQWLIPVECLESGPTQLAPLASPTDDDDAARATVLRGPRGPRSANGRKLDRY